MVFCITMGWISQQFRHICIFLIILSTTFTPIWTSPTISYSSSSLPSLDDFQVDEESPSELMSPTVSTTSSSVNKLNDDVAVGANKTATSGLGVCGCDALEMVVAEVRKMKDICVDIGSVVDKHVKKVDTLQIAVDGLADIIDTNQADQAVKPVRSTPTVSTASSESDPPFSSSTESDIDIEMESEHTADPVVNIGQEVPQSLGRINIVVMEEPDVIPRDCLEVQQRLGNVTGVYTILPDGCGQPFQVFCDMHTSGGGWTVIQRRQDGTVDFARPWGVYRRGFGPLLGEFWLGLDKMSRLTRQDDYELRIDLHDFNGTEGSAEYESFRVGDYWSNFRLNLGAFKINGSAGDSLGYHNSMPFSTYDRDNDLAKKNCADLYSLGGWWYNGCLYSNLNGLYLGPDNKDFAQGVTWYEFAGFYHSVKFAEMKVRPVT